MDQYVARTEYEEHNKRMDDEHIRQNKRISKLEQNVETLQKLAASVEKLADNMQRMLQEQERQGQEIAALKDKPVKKWESAQAALTNAFLGSVGTAIAGGIFWLLTTAK